MGFKWHAFFVQHFGKMCDLAYMKCGQLWETPLSTVSKETFLKNIKSGRATFVVVSLLQFRPPGGRDRDVDGGFINSTLDRIQQNHLIVNELTKKVADNGVHRRSLGNSHVIIDALDGPFPCDYASRKMFTKEYLAMSDELYLLRINAIQKVFARFDINVTGAYFGNIVLFIN